MKTIIKNIVKNFFGVVCTIITLLQFFLETDTYKKFKEHFNIPENLLEQYKIHIFIVALLLISAYIIYVYITNNKQLVNAANQMHLFYHKLRDETFTMRKANTKTVKKDHMEFYKDVKDACYPLCEYISKFLKCKLKKDFSVCIKMIDDASLKKHKNIDQSRVYTLCRYGKEKEKREENEKNTGYANGKKEDHPYIPVKGNSDFYTILSNSKKNIATTAFACSNLRMLYILGKILKNVKYENTTHKFWKYYKSTVVVPIRIEQEFLPNTFEVHLKDDAYQTIAFLCIDHKKPISMFEKEEIAGFAKDFADALYYLFYEIAIMDRAIAAKKEKMRVLSKEIV